MRKLLVVVLSTALFISAGSALARPGGKGGASGAARGGPGPGAAPRSGASHPGASGGIRSNSGAGAKSNLKGTLENGALDSIRRSGEGSLRDQLGISPDQLHDLSGERPQRGSEWKAAVTSGPQPFSPAWYAEHPHAWQYAHPHADAWAVATAAGVSRWFGWAAAPYGSSSATTAEGESTPATSENQEPTADEAQDLAQSGAAEPSADSQWLPLGVYALAPQDQNEATLLVQLAVNKEGVVRGNYYDVLADQGQTVQGAVDLKTQQTAFTVGKGKAVFNTTIGSLTNRSTPVSLLLDGGSALAWKLVRLEQSQPETK